MTWRVFLPCTRDEAERLNLAEFAGVEPTPTLVTGEADGGGWRLDAYFETRPSAGVLTGLRALVPSAADTTPQVERVAAADWVTLSQAGLEPVRTGRFFVHTPAWRSVVPERAIAFEIGAGLAFGTGHHETTRLCLEMLDALKRQGTNPRRIADVGTGTGLLAFAAARLWPAARVIASDADPEATRVAADNAAVNRVRIGRGPGRIELVTADGLNHPRLQALAPFDLILANILAGPLIAMAPMLALALASGGGLVLAGLLDRQEDEVVAAYRRAGMMPLARRDAGEWPALLLRKRKRKV
ncbi:MAG: 50S ribosomal protein L11 methyltransferase [Sphingosinicella sp.]